MSKHSDYVSHTVAVVFRVFLYIIFPIMVHIFKELKWSSSGKTELKLYKLECIRVRLVKKRIRKFASKNVIFNL